MKQKVEEMEEEAAKLRKMQAQVEKEMNMGDPCIFYFFQGLITYVLLL